MCYLFLVVLGVTKILRRRRLVLALLMVASLYRSLSPYNSGWPRSVTWDVPYFGSLWELPRFVSYFLAGVSAYLWRDRIRHSGLVAVAVVGVLGLGYALRLQPLILPACVAYLILYVAFDRRVPLERVGAYGDFSYGVYLYAFPIQQVLVDRLTIARHAPVLTAMALPITMLVAIGSWKCVEEPFLRLRRNAAALMPSDFPWCCQGLRAASNSCAWRVADYGGNRVFSW